MLHAGCSTGQAKNGERDGISLDSANTLCQSISNPAVEALGVLR
jgi:hypothetical protein